MPRSGLFWPAAFLLCALFGLPAPNMRGDAVGGPLLTPKLHAQRTSPDDLEVAGELAGVPGGAKRYLTREDLLSAPQVTFTVRDDNFAQPTKVSGVPLDELARDLGAAPSAGAVVAICDDEYRANYSHAYLAEHRPVLVLAVDGQPPSGWPKDPGGHDMGPYLISQAKFIPAFTIHSYSDQPLVPWGVERLEFHSEATVFNAIAPHGQAANDPAVADGFKIARQNCFRCHNMAGEGGQKSGVPWTVVALVAANSPNYFAQYVRNPMATNPQTQMEASPGYDDATVHALIAYFRTFTAGEKP